MSKVKSPEQKLAECKAEQEKDRPNCGDLAEEMRLIDTYRIKDELSPEAREVRMSQL